MEVLAQELYTVTHLCLIWDQDDTAAVNTFVALSPPEPCASVTLC